MKNQTWRGMGTILLHSYKDKVINKTKMDHIDSWQNTHKLYEISFQALTQKQMAYWENLAWNVKTFAER